MPRSVGEDQLQSFRFRVLEVQGGPGIFDDEDPVAGFNNITIPGITFEVTEHRVGNQKFTRKFLGVPTFEDCTMTRGILLGDTTIFD